LLGTDLVVAAAPALAAQPVPARVLVTERPDRLSATITARSQGSRVEIVDERTEFSSTFVNPDGTSTVEQHAGQIRYRDHGLLKDVDLTLERRADGTIAPRGHALGLVLGKGGAAKGSVLATIGDGHGRQVTLGTPAPLPEPVLDGTTATYPNVTPGVDVVVDARRTGFEQSFVLKTRPTGPVSWQLPLLTKGLTARAESDGSVSFVDSTGAVVSTLPPATAWDAVVDPASGDHANTSSVRLTVTQQSPGKAVLTVTPNASWLSDPARVFPVTVDPTDAAKSSTTSFDTYVQSDTVTDTSALTELRAGTYGTGVVKARSFLNFPQSAFNGLTIMSGQLNLWETYATSCTPKAVSVYGASANVSTSTRWATAPTYDASPSGTATVSKGPAGCAAGWIAIPMTGKLQNWSAAGVSTVTAAVTASETDTSVWKKFDSLEGTHDPYISFTYDRKPGLASQPTLSPVVPYQASGDVAAVNYTSSLRPTFTARASDSDGNTVQVTYEVHSNSTFTSLVQSCAATYVAQNADAPCTLATALADDTQYWVRAKVYDGSLWNGYWSPGTTFRTAAAAPVTPTINCPAPYTNGSWQDATPTQDVSCTITTTVDSSTPAGQRGFVAPGSVTYTIDQQPYVWHRVTAPNTSTGLQTTTTTVTVPKTSGAHTIVVHTSTGAGNVGSTATYSFGYGGTALSSPQVSPRTTTSGVLTIGASGPPRLANALPTPTLQWRLAGSGNETTGWNAATGASLTASDGGVSTNPVTVTGSWDTRQATTDTAAGITLNDRLPTLMDVQVCLPYSSGTQCTWSQQPVSVLRVPHAFGNGFPTATAGPGQVALWTGEFDTSATDVNVPGYAGALSLGRSHSTYAGATDTATGVFGPGWTASLQGPDAGDAGLQVVDSTRVDGTLALVDGDGSAMVFSRPGGRRTSTSPSLNGTYTPADENTIASQVTAAISGSGTGTQLLVTDPDGTITTYTITAAPSSSTDATFLPTAVATPVDPKDSSGVGSPTKYLPDTVNPARVGRIVASAPAGITCPTAANTDMQSATFRGCRALTLEYVPTTTSAPTGSTIGDYPDRLGKVWMELWDPAANSGAGAMTKTQVAQYGYDSSGHLRTVTDPRNGLSTGYTYSGDKLASLTPPGQAAYQLDYTSESTPRLARVRRVRPDSTVATLGSYVYDNVPLSGTGLPDLTGAAVAAWSQTSAPTRAMAVFGPDHPLVDPASTPVVSGSGLSSSDWAYASLQYTDPLGYTVNSASYGASAWQVSATDYDSNGNVIRTLDSQATAAAPGLNAQQVDQLANITVYNTGLETFPNASLYPAGTLVLDTYGPSRWALRADGTSAYVRPHTHTDYDQGAPNSGLNPATGQPYVLATTSTVSAFAGAVGTPSGDVETESTSTTGYTDAVDSSNTSGWAYGTPTVATTKNATITNSDNSTSTADLVRITRYDGESRAVESRQPLGNGSDAGTTLTRYWTAAGNSTDSDCGNKPEWAGLVCKTLPSGAPSSGPTLPTKWVQSYSALLAPTVITETSGTVTRTSTLTYLSDGRTDISRTAVSGLSSSTATTDSKSIYDSSTGMPTESRALTAGTSTETGDKTVTGYDSWGRPISYSTVDAGVTETTTTSYDSAGRVAQVTDPQGTTTSSYDGTDAAGKTEHRGLPTALTVTRPGLTSLSFGAAYDAAGQLVTQTLPGGISQGTVYDQAGEPVARSYSGPVTNPDLSVTTDVWLGWAQDNDVLGRVRHEWTPNGAAFTGAPADPNSPTPDVGDALSYDRAYSYDQAGRLLQVQDRTALTTGVDVDADTFPAAQAPCAVRTYGFDRNGNRVALRTATGTPSSPSCDLTGGTTVRHSYDTADRLVSGPDGTGSYSYDELGRTLSMPVGDTPNGRSNGSLGALTIGYYDNDLARTLTQNSVTTTFTLDSTGRRKTATTAPSGGGTATDTLVRHYTDGSDNPGWTADTPAGQATAITHYAESLGGDLGVEVNADGSCALPLATLHGDDVTTVAVPSTGNANGITSWADYDEYGNPRNAVTAKGVGGAVGYGWLGAKQRATTDTGLQLMGARLYNPAIGQFTSVDPVAGGNVTRYTYPIDPINAFDLSGLSEAGESERGGGPNVYFVSNESYPRMVTGESEGNYKRLPSRVRGRPGTLHRVGRPPSRFDYKFRPYSMHPHREGSKWRFILSQLIRIGHGWHWW
jgi:RHS repeat-associated protein